VKAVSRLLIADIAARGKPSPATALPPEAATLARTTDIDVNFAKFIDYRRCLGTGFGNAINLKLKCSEFNRLYENTTGCSLQIRCRFAAESAGRSATRNLGLCLSGRGYAVPPR
jgi:hypothetical protein